MKTVRKIFPILSLVVIFYFVTSCIDQDGKNSSITPTNRSTDPVLSYVLALGIPGSSIKDIGSAYLVEGDILFPKDMMIPKKSSSVNGREEQYYSGTLVGFSKQANIKVMIDPSISAQSAEINSAVSLWNNSGAVSTSGANIYFRVVTAAPYDILISNVNLGSGVCGMAGFPSNGNPFPTVSINVGEVSSDTYNQRVVNIAHELGHCIGFWHTNSGSGSYTSGGTTWYATAIPNDGGTDSNSIMNGGMCHSLSTTLSSKDVYGLFSMYNSIYPTNLQMSISSYQFSVSWGPKTILSAPTAHIGYEVQYGGFSGINFGGTTTLPASSTSFVVPGVSPYPTSGTTNTGGIQVTVIAKYSDGTRASVTVSKSKSNGVWN